MKNKFTEKLQNKEFLIMDHRGFWGGNIIQNTRQATMLSFRAGADIVEIDVCRTSDGEYYLFHDGNEEVLLGEDKHFTKWTSEEIDATPVINTANEPSGYYLEKLEDYLAWLPDGKLINIDRAWFFFDDPKFIEILTASEKMEQIFLKSPVDEKYLNILSDLEINIPFVPIVKKKADFEKVLQYDKIYTIGLEVIAKTEDHECYDQNWLIELRDQGYLVLANAINLGTGHNLFANLNDDAALMEDPDHEWGQILEMGVNVMQTDWPNFMNEYRENR